MALHRGIQSAIFYYLSCAPCTESRIRKKRRQDAERDRANRAALEEHMPGLYQHPEPSSTNPHWQTEIEAGPVPSRTRRKQADNSRGTNRAMSMRSNIASSVSIDASMSMERSDSALSGIGPYQRNDEALWGSRASNISGRPRLGTASSSRDVLPIRPPRAALKDSRTRSYHSSNPAINELHPPTTRKVQSKEEISWMMQPPPVPEIMSGKARSYISRSESATSRPSTSIRSNNASRPSSQRAGPASPTITPIEEAVSPPSRFLEVPVKLTRSRTLPVRHHKSSPSQSSIRKPPPALQLSQDDPSSRETSRPSLHTIMSEGVALDDSENDRPRHNSLDSRSILHPKQAGPNSTVLERRSGATISPKKTRLQSPSFFETRLYVPGYDSSDEHEPFDAQEWTAPDFELPEWIHEHTRRDVRERWSFDL